MKSPYKLALAGAFGLVAGVSAMEVQHTQPASTAPLAYLICMLVMGLVLLCLAVAIGFAVLRFSQFVPFSNFGMMVCIATAGSSLGNLVLLPACLTLGHRWKTRLAGRRAAVSAVEA